MKLHLPLRLLSALMAALSVPGLFAATIQVGDGEATTVSTLNPQYTESVVLTIGDGDALTTPVNARFESDTTLNISGGTFTLPDTTLSNSSIVSGIGFGASVVNINMTGGTLTQGQNTLIGDTGKVNISLSGSAVMNSAGAIGNGGGAGISIELSDSAQLTTNGSMGSAGSSPGGSLEMTLSGSSSYDGKGTTFIGRGYTSTITVKDNATFTRSATGFGGSGSTLVFNVQDSATATLSATTLGDSSSNSTFNVSGGSLTVTSVTTFGGSNSTLNINVSGGAFEITRATTLGDSGSHVNFDISGGTCTIANANTFGGAGSVVDIRVSGGKFTSATSIVKGMGAQKAQSLTITITGGVFEFGSSTGSTAVMGSTSGDAAPISIAISGSGAFYQNSSRVCGASLTLADQGSYHWDATGNPGEFTSITINGGSLVNADKYYSNSLGQRYSTQVTIDTPTSFTGDLSLGGLSAAYISQLTTAAPVHITDLGNNSKDTAANTLTLQGTSNAMVVDNTSAWSGTSTTAPDGARALINFREGAGTISFAEGGSMTLHFTGDALGRADAAGNLNIVIWLTNGSLDAQGADVAEWVKQHFLPGEGWGLEISLQDAVNGMLLVTGSTGGVWWTGTHPKNPEGTVDATPSEFDGYTAVLLEQDTHIAMSAAENEVTLKQLEGTANLHISSDGSAADAYINNTSGVASGDTSFSGDISTDSDVTLHKSGDATFTANGDLQVAGDLSVDEGSLVIGPQSNSSANSISDIAQDASLVVNGSLRVGKSDLSAAQGSISGSGNLALEGDLALGANSSLSGVKLGLNGNTLTTNGANVNIQALDGTGSIQGAVTVSSGSGEFTGNLDSLTVGGTAQQTLDNGATLSGSLTVQNGAELSLHVRGDSGRDTVHVAQDTSLNTGSLTTFNVHLNGDALSHEALSVAGTLTLGAGAIFRLREIGSILPAGDLNCRLITCTGLNGDLQAVNMEYSPLFKLYYKNLRLVDQTTGEPISTISTLAAAPYAEAAHTIALVGEENTENNLAPLAESEVALAGSELLFAALRTPEMLAPGTPLNQLRNALADLMDTNPRAASRAMAAVAGSTVTALGAAQRDALRGEMLRLRSHAAFPIPEQQKGEYRRVSTWIEGNGMFNELDTNGDLSGYRLHSWGGSVGAAFSPARDVTLGLSLSAQYGDLKAHAADSASGDLDGYYLSLLGHMQRRAWGHSLVATLGVHEAKLNRFVDYGSGSYATHGKTNGIAFGAVYELTYDLPMNEARTSVLQPLISAAIVTTSMDSYSESGAGGAGLLVGDQRWTTGTVSAGLRWLTALGNAFFNKAANAELRINVAQDMGDNQGEADVALQANPGLSRRVRGAKIGSTALQLGAGLSLPLATDTLLYTGANLDLRSGMNQWNVHLGFRMLF